MRRRAFLFLFGERGLQALHLRLQGAALLLQLREHLLRSSERDRGLRIGAAGARFGADALLRRLGELLFGERALLGGERRGLLEIAALARGLRRLVLGRGTLARHAGERLVGDRRTAQRERRDERAVGFAFLTFGRRPADHFVVGVGDMLVRIGLVDGAKPGQRLVQRLDERRIERLACLGSDLGRGALERERRAVIRR